MKRYIGRIATIPGDDGYAFIGIGSVMKDDGSEHDLGTRVDIFLHKDECRDPLMVGMEVTFDVVPDRVRGDGTYRAVGASKVVECELLPAQGNAIPGFPLTIAPVSSNGGTNVAVRLPVHTSMKDVPAETVALVSANRPLPGVSRDFGDIPRDEEAKHRLTQWLLTMLFPQLIGFEADYRILGYSDAELDQIVHETVNDYSAMGLEQEVEVVFAEVKRFKDVRAALGMIVEEDLVRPDTVIPIQYLPDLFMAVPVWYFWFPPREMAVAQKQWENGDPSPHEAVRHFCGLFPSQRWCDTFQLFNRRTRTLRQYKGEVIPPAAIRRMRRAVELFDYVVIATPYHDMAGKDWEDLEWIRAIDPYILAFKKGIPFFFVLARFSDSGTFPLFNELVGDTIEFLRNRKVKLNGFNRVNSPFWCHADGSEVARMGQFGEHLKNHVDKLLAAFESGNLFDWLRANNL